MTGLGNHSKLDAGDGKVSLVGRGVTVTKHRMYAADVPFVDPDNALSPIHGEVWDVDAATLERVDALEGHPDWYVRAPARVMLDDDQSVVEADMYVNRKFLQFGMDKEAVIVRSGDFRDADTAEKREALRNVMNAAYKADIMQQNGVPNKKAKNK
jgi:gamma-glutamylcyclotransferase (GGCT)/AIG2-like uncharacterized protein YtfP